MLSRWSIRTSLTLVGVVLVALTVVVGALGLTALSGASSSLDRISRGDLIAIHALDDASSFSLRARVSLDRSRGGRVAREHRLIADWLALAAIEAGLNPYPAQARPCPCGVQVELSLAEHGKEGHPPWNS